MRSRVLLSAFAAAAIAIPTLALPQAADAGTYPGNKCVSDKLKAASSKCKAALGAWSKFVGGGGDVDDGTKRDDALFKATSKMNDAWSKAEAKASSKGVDCVDTTLAQASMQTLINDAIDAIVTDVSTGLTLSNKDHAKCGATLLKAAASKCAALLKNEGGYVGKLSAGKGKRDAGNDKADDKFEASVTNALVGCPTMATLISLDEGVDELTEDVITNSIISPNVDDSQFTTLSPGANEGVVYEGTVLTPTCAFDTPYHYFVKRGSVNKLVMYYQGGGACWDATTCVSIGTFDEDVQPAGSDNPNNTTTGFGDLTNPLNPFADWNIVFVSYCTGDIHFGDSVRLNAGEATNHKGWHNARIAEKFAREHFVAPDEVFVTGSSAGAYGALFNAPLHHDVWPSAQFSVLGDAGNGVITEEFLEDQFPKWNFVAHLPPNIPGVVESIENGTGLPAYLKAVANYYPDTAWGNYTSAYDGGTGGQTGFLNVMQQPSPANWVSWWNATCEWGDTMVAQALDVASDVAATTDNYRYYIGTGSRHTMYGSDKVYTDTTGNVPTIVDWVNAMINRTPAWTNVQCDSPTSCGTLLPGDPQPASLPTAPFSQVGPDVVITCP